MKPMAESLANGRTMESAPSTPKKSGWFMAEGVRSVGWRRQNDITMPFRKHEPDVTTNYLIPLNRANFLGADKAHGEFFDCWRTSASQAKELFFARRAISDGVTAAVDRGNSWNLGPSER